MLHHEFSGTWALCSRGGCRWTLDSFFQDQNTSLFQLFCFQFTETLQLLNVVWSVCETVRLSSELPPGHGPVTLCLLSPHKSHSTGLENLLLSLNVWPSFLASAPHKEWKFLPCNLSGKPHGRADVSHEEIPLWIACNSPSCFTRYLGCLVFSLFCWFS